MPSDVRDTNKRKCLRYRRCLRHDKSTARCAISASSSAVRHPNNNVRLRAMILFLFIALSRNDIPTVTYVIAYR